MPQRPSTGAQDLPRVRKVRNEADADVLLGQIGTLERNAEQELAPLRRERNRLRQELAKINKQMDAARSRYGRVVLARAGKVLNFAEAQKERLTARFKAKTIKLRNGVFSWRLSPVALTVTDPTALMVSLKKEGVIDQFLRQQPRFDLAALRQRAELLKKLEGIEPKRVTRFSIVPEGARRRLVIALEPGAAWEYVPLSQKAAA